MPGTGVPPLPASSGLDTSTTVTVSSSVAQVGQPVTFTADVAGDLGGAGDSVSFVGVGAVGAADATFARSHRSPGSTWRTARRRPCLKNRQRALRLSRRPGAGRSTPRSPATATAPRRAR